MNLDTLDKSFLRLVTDFSVAKSEMMDNGQYINKDTIVISPTNKTLQISNSLTSIAFDDSYIVSLVDCSDNVMLDITNKVYINEFQDINGIYQIAFEILPIGFDYYNKTLFIKFKHIDSDLTLWSNPINVTDTLQTIRLDYKNYSYYEGISYDRANFFQSIDLTSFYNGLLPKETTNIYTQSNGDIRTGRTTQALEYTYNINAIDTFTFDRLMVALNSDVVYLNGVRFRKSEVISIDDRQGATNQFQCSFKGQFIANDNYIADYQIAPPFTIVALSPLGLYISSPSSATATMNINVASVSNFKLFDYNTDLLIEDPTVLVNLNSFNASFAALSIGKYYFTFDAVSELGQTISISNKDVWMFEITNGEFDKTEFNTEFFTN